MFLLGVQEKTVQGKQLPQNSRKNVSRWNSCFFMNLTPEILKSIFPSNFPALRAGDCCVNPEATLGTCFSGISVSHASPGIQNNEKKKVPNRHLNSRKKKRKRKVAYRGDSSAKLSAPAPPTI
jgi:hypothetical protein